MIWLAALNELDNQKWLFTDGPPIIIYLDDILLYSENMQDHVLLVKQVLDHLQKHQLVIVPDKYK